MQLNFSTKIIIKNVIKLFELSNPTFPLHSYYIVHSFVLKALLVLEAENVNTERIVERRNMNGTVEQGG